MLALTLIATLGAAGAPGAPSVVDQASRALLSQADAPLAPPAMRRSLFDLNHELQDLEHDRPGLGFPIAFIAVGGAALVFDGVISFWFAVLLGVSSFYAVLPVVIVIAAIAVAGFLGTGFLMLGIRLHQRKSYDERIEALQAELRAREGEHPYNLQREDLPLPPPPPPPPPQGFAPGPSPALVLAEF